MDWIVHIFESNVGPRVLQNLVPLILLRPLRLFVSADTLRRWRIILLKSTHVGFVLVIWAYEYTSRHLAAAASFSGVIRRRDENASIINGGASGVGRGPMRLTPLNRHHLLGSGPSGGPALRSIKRDETMGLGGVTKKKNPRHAPSTSISSIREGLSGGGRRVRSRPFGGASVSAPRNETSSQPHQPEPQHKPQREVEAEAEAEPSTPTRGRRPIIRSSSSMMAAGLEIESSSHHDSIPNRGIRPTDPDDSDNDDDDDPSSGHHFQRPSQHHRHHSQLSRGAEGGGAEGGGGGGHGSSTTTTRSINELKAMVQQLSRQVEQLTVANREAVISREEGIGSGSGSQQQ
ncbi:MAG: exocyst complex component exo84 [Watsoniomyces obsoletus]|nr:MAG: exocyst complex component exo84 [Watsoniomyces obsoletus]